jgi:endonuclease III
MKRAAKHADRFRSLARSLLRGETPSVPEPQEPLPTLVRAAMSFDVSDAKADEAMRLINHEFVDLNELRVATQLEIQELLGQRYPRIEDRVEMITQSLNAIFMSESKLSLDRLRTIPKREARQFLKELPGIHPFVEAYVMLFAFDSPAFPMDDQIAQFLVEEGALKAGLSLDEAQRFAENHLKAEETRDVFMALRRAAADDGGHRNRKARG